MMFIMKKSIFFSCLSTLMWAETVTLAPIDIHEEGLRADSVVLSENEAKETKGQSYYLLLEWKT